MRRKIRDLLIVISSVCLWSEGASAKSGLEPTVISPLLDVVEATPIFQIQPDGQFNKPDTTLLLSQISTQFKYDSRGRLSEQTNGSGEGIVYEFDDAGNRLKTYKKGEPLPPPKITVFAVPSAVTRGSNFTASWRTENASYCEITMSDGGLNARNLPPNGSAVGLFTATAGITLSCYNGGQEDTAFRLIRPYVPPGGTRD